jgi:hypothetical protein
MACLQLWTTAGVIWSSGDRHAAGEFLRAGSGEECSTCSVRVGRRGEGPSRRSARSYRRRPRGSRHLTAAVSLLGFGRGNVEFVAVDAQGRMRVDALPPLDDHTVRCIQAGNVNSGALDPARDFCAAAQGANAWVHIDGAFGLWARAAPRRAHLAAGVELVPRAALAAAA